MKAFGSFSLLSFSLFLLLTLHCKANAQQLIHKTCKTSSKQDPNIDYSFCVTSLQAAPASRCATLGGLGKISFRLIWNNVTDIRCHIRQLKMNKKLNPFVKMCLDDCFKLYSEALPAIKRATKSYHEKRFMDANIEISSVMDAATTCEGEFKEKRGVVSSLTKNNGDIFELSAMTLSIMHMIDSNSY